MRPRLSTVTDQRRRPAGVRRRGHGAPRPAPPARSEQRHREAGGPLDVAHYACGCGHAFAAAVSTSVACPECGAGQDW